MDAILLAAGLGTRLRPHTLHTPKPMLLVRGRPILDWIARALPGNVDRLIVVVHHLAEQVEDYLRKQSRFRDWVSVPQTNPRGTGDALQLPGARSLRPFSRPQWRRPVRHCGHSPARAMPRSRPRPCRR